jgi:hypothetical protein
MTKTAQAEPKTAANAVPAIPKLVVPLGRGSRGKTWWLRWAIDRAQSQGRAVVVADADRTNATLSHYFEDVTSPPSADDRDVREWIKALIEQQIEQHFTAVLDLGGGDLMLKRVAREFGLIEFFEEYGVQPVAVHLIGPDQDDLAYLTDVEAGGVFAPKATILVFNEALVPSHLTTRGVFEETVRNNPILNRTIERGARLVWMPRLEPATKIDLRRLNFSAARAGHTKPGQTPIGPLDRQLIARWQRAMEEAFQPVADWLP